MSVEWGRLRVLDAVARSGSVTRAAAMLRMTGPAVSQQLRRIAAEAGAEIVTAEGRGVRLTDQGRLLADYARRVSELMRQADNDLHRADGPAGSVRVGALASLIRGRLARRLPTFWCSHPRVKVGIEDGETVDHLDRLTVGRLDLVLAESWSTAPLRLPAGVRAQRLVRERVRVALPGDHPLRHRNTLDFADLAAEPWATCGRDSHGHVALVQAARERGVELDIRHFVADHATQLALVAGGLALACVPAADDSGDTGDTGAVYRLLTPEMHRDILLLTGDRTPSPALSALTEHLGQPE
ncbi:hypothetical protein B1813_14400 [Saccharomonospora piscinae]|uniref:HTH lysR-type domain-containing protein n=1 Tax=Saccharomonospora piscinae TaxID=687388 RepID=A0A1V9A0W9_SACPI|nr:LysR family transcriptional regulator [Saccharomonospora piscinae]OQO90731.1 hypothetical protein B1813_14400 [Saccharomonospora piscinae]